MNESWQKRDVLYVERASNPLGTAAFVLSLISLLTLGTFSVLSLILSAVAMGGKPKDLAVSGLVISLVQLPFGIGVVWFAMTAGYVLNRAASHAASTPAPSSVAGPANVSAAALRVTNAKLSKQTNGRDYMVSLDLHNTSTAVVTRVSLQVEMVDFNGEVLAKDVFKLAIPTRLVAGAKRPFEIDLPRYSPLNADLPGTARPRVSILDVQTE